MEKQQLTLRESQLESLRILKELDRFCTENNLCYYIGCGTLIGAVRHKGFIPWDDDVDVFMPRPDFERLINLYVSNNFILRTIYNDKSHPFNFGHLCSKKVYSLFGKKHLYDFGIDIYVINGAPAEKEKQTQLIRDVFIHIKRKEQLKRLRDGLMHKHLWPFKTLDFALMNRELFKAEQAFKRYNFDTSDYIWPYGGGRLIMKKENYGTPVRLQFEDALFLAPEHYHEVLTLAYGNYMQLPPEEKRKPYHSSCFYWE